MLYIPRRLRGCDAELFAELAHLRKLGAGEQARDLGPQARAGIDDLDQAKCSSPAGSRYLATSNVRGPSARAFVGVGLHRFGLLELRP